MITPLLPVYRVRAEKPVFPGFSVPTPCPPANNTA